MQNKVQGFGEVITLSVAFAETRDAESLWATERIWFLSEQARREESSS